MRRSTTWRSDEHFRRFYHRTNRKCACFLSAAFDLMILKIRHSLCSARAWFLPRLNFEVGQPIRSCLTAFLLLIPNVTLWPWTWPWPFGYFYCACGEAATLELPIRNSDIVIQRPGFLKKEQWFGDQTTILRCDLPRHCYRWFSTFSPSLLQYVTVQLWPLTPWPWTFCCRSGVTWSNSFERNR